MATTDIIGVQSASASVARESEDFGSFRANGAEPAAARNGGSPSAPAIDPLLQSPDLFLNRELTWLNFNWRVLAEAEDPRNPLLERLRFLAITASNLDEFFMKRIGGLKQQLAAGVHELTADGRTPRRQIVEA